MSNKAVSFTHRQSLLAQLKNNKDHQWDIIVIGGGIIGAGVLREARRRGLKALLIEQRDLAWGTSSRSSKMVHGGLRYIAQGDIKITKLKVSGGGSQSDEAMQITADIFGITAERPHTFETSALGAAINAAVGVCLYDSYQTALAYMTHEGDKFEPITESKAIYEQLYRDVYQKMYQRLSPLYKSIRAITGYPN